MAQEVTTTRAELRKRVADLLGDLVELEATSSGTALTFIDSINLSNALESPVNRDIVFRNGTNLGEMRRISSWSVGTGTLTWTTALPAATVAGDTAELYNRAAKGWRKVQYDNAINAAIDASWPVYKEPYEIELGTTFSSDDPVITVPDAMTHVSIVQYLDGNDQWVSIPSSSWGHYESLEEIVVSGDSLRGTMDGYAIRLIGATRPTPLTDDTDTTAIRPDFIVYQAAALLCQNRYARGEAEFYNPMLLNQQFADKFKPRSRNTGVAVRVL